MLDNFRTKELSEIRGRKEDFKDFPSLHKVFIAINVSVCNDK